jgi:hypothetical protein
MLAENTARLAPSIPGESRNIPVASGQKGSTIFLHS